MFGRMGMISGGGGGGDAGVPFDVGIAVPSADVRAVLFVDGTGALATLGDENGLGTTGVNIGRLKVAEHVNDNLFLGHHDANTSSTNYQLFCAANGTLKIKAPGAATAMTIIAGDSGASAGSLTVNGEATVRFRWGNTGIAFFGVAESARNTGWTAFSNLSSDKTCDANATTVEELADILGTLIEELKTKGLLSV